MTDLETRIAERDAAIAAYAAALTAADVAYRAALRSLTTDSGHYAATRASVVYEAARDAARATMLADRAAWLASEGEYHEAFSAAHEAARATMLADRAAALAAQAKEKNDENA